jgi:hypothetical protein
MRAKFLILINFFIVSSLFGAACDQSGVSQGRSRSVGTTLFHRVWSLLPKANDVIEAVGMGIIDETVINPSLGKRTVAFGSKVGLGGLITLGAARQGYHRFIPVKKDTIFSVNHRTFWKKLSCDNEIKSNQGIFERGNNCSDEQSNIKIMEDKKIYQYDYPFIFRQLDKKYQRSTVFDERVSGAPQSNRWRLVRFFAEYLCGSIISVFCNKYIDSKLLPLKFLSPMRSRIMTGTRHGLVASILLSAAYRPIINFGLNVIEVGLKAAIKNRLERLKSF